MVEGRGGGTCEVGVKSHHEHKPPAHSEPATLSHRATSPISATGRSQEPSQTPAHAPPPPQATSPEGMMVRKCGFAPF